MSVKRAEDGAAYGTATDLQLGLQLGYWTAQPPTGSELTELAQQVEAFGSDSIWLLRVC